VWIGSDINLKYNKTP